MPDGSPRADVLIITVNKIESQSVMKVFQQATGKDPQPIPIDDRIYHDLGEVNGERIFLGLSEMGASGLGASQQAVQKDISALRPSAVILAGIAFGVNEQRQAIGDILVSQQLWLYDLQRIGNEIIPRGDKPHASAKLIDRFRNADLHWMGAKVRFGLILTGEKLIDNVDYRDQLKAFEKEAIGGEMEGTGIYIACQDAHVDWILVKAICDWADGNKTQDKDKRQQLAADNAAQFVLQAFNLTSFKMRNQEEHHSKGAIDSRPHIQEEASILLPHESPFKSFGAIPLEHRKPQNLPVDTMPSKADAFVSLPTDSPFNPYGTIPFDHPSYITRDSDRLLEKLLSSHSFICLHGDFCY